MKFGRLLKDKMVSTWGSFNFDLPVVAANSTTDAYNFVAGATDAAYGFLGSAITATNDQVYPLMQEQTSFMDQIGNLFGNAANTAASKISSGNSGGLFGFLGF